MIVRFLFALAIVSVVGACATRPTPAAPTWVPAEPVAALPVLASMTTLLDDIQLGLGRSGSVSAVRGQGGLILYLHLPVHRIANGAAVQDLSFAYPSVPVRIFRFDLDGDGRLELALDQSGGPIGAWAIMRGRVVGPEGEPAYWETWRVPVELFDPAEHDAELVLDLTMAAQN